MLWSFASTGAEVAGVASSTSDPAVVTSGASANTMGSWTELTASTSYNAFGLTVLVRSVSFLAGTNGSSYMDIGVGGAGSERVIVEGIQFGFSVGNFSAFVPVFIPAGSRVCARIRSAYVAFGVATQILLQQDQGAAWCRSTTYGVVTASSGGTALTAPGGANTKGAWTQITSSTTAPIRFLLPTIQPANSNNLTAIDALFDIGVGGSGSEVPVLSNLSHRQTADEAQTAPVTGVFVSIPTGSRLVARYAADSTAQPPRITLIGVG